MFDELQSEKRKLNLMHPLKVVAASAGGILLSFGLCGANLLMGQRAAVGIGVPALARTGVALFVVSLGCFISGVFWLIGAAIVNAVRS